jgi:hypothetical protein
MGMSMHDRYYEPEDDDNEDMDEWMADWIKFESREGGYIDPKEGTNFAEALGELGMREDIAQWDDCTEAEKAQIVAYWLDMGEKLAEDAYYDRNY